MEEHHKSRAEWVNSAKKSVQTQIVSSATPGSTQLGTYFISDIKKDLGY